MVVVCVCVWGGDAVMPGPPGCITSGQTTTQSVRFVRAHVRVGKGFRVAEQWCEDKRHYFS